jgi:hypothetical protein
MPPGRGRCPVCRYSYALHKDGTVQSHSLYFGRDRKRCEGSWRLPGSLTGAERDVAWRKMVCAAEARPLA